MTTDVNGLANILVGRLDAIRCDIDGIIEDFSQKYPDRGMKQRETPSTKVDHESSSPPETLLMALKAKLDHAEQNLQLLDTYGQHFEARTNALDDISPLNKNRLIELQWKRDIQHQGQQALHIYQEQLGYRFPHLTTSIHGLALHHQESSCSSLELSIPPPLYFTPSFTLPSSSCFTSLDSILNSISESCPQCTFQKQLTTSGDATSLIVCQVGQEFQVLLSFSPAVPNDYTSASPLPSVNTPTATGDENLNGTTAGASKSSRRLTRANHSTSNSTKQQRRRYNNPHQGPSSHQNMVSRAKQAAQDASKMEEAEILARAVRAFESAKEREQAREFGQLVSAQVERVSISSLREQSSSGGVWDESEFQVYQHLTQIAREVLAYYIKLYPESAIQYFFHWIGCYDQLFSAACRKCKKILIKDSDASRFLPPLYRVFQHDQAGVVSLPTGAGAGAGAQIKYGVYHAQCLPYHN